MKNANANAVEIAMNLLDFARTATLGEYLRFVEVVRREAGENAADLAVKALELSCKKVAV